MNDRLGIDVVFTDEPPEIVADALKELGATDVYTVHQRGFTGVEIVILAVVAIQALANLVIKLLPLWKCGIIVDARGSKIRTEKNCDLPRGTVLFIAPDGTKSTLHEPSEIDLKSMLGALPLKS